MIDLWYDFFFPVAGEVTNGHLVTSGEEFLMKGILTITTIFMIICVCKKGFTDSRLFEDDRKWSDLCGTVIARIHKLMPEHRRTMLIYAKATQMDIRKKPMLDLMRALPAEVKIEAERDLCLHDVYHPDAISMLKMQFMTILKTQESGT